MSEHYISNDKILTVSCSILVFVTVVWLGQLWTWSTQCLVWSLFTATVTMIESSFSFITAQTASYCTHDNETEQCSTLLLVSAEKSTRNHVIYDSRRGLYWSQCTFRLLLAYLIAIRMMSAHSFTQYTLSITKNSFTESRSCNMHKSDSW